MNIATELHVVHVITNLDSGGAQAMMIRLVNEMRRSGVNSAVISLMPRGEFSHILDGMHIPVFYCDLQGLFTLPFAARRLMRHVARLRPLLIQSWLPHADFLSSLVGLALKRPVVWNIRNSSPGAGPGPLSLIYRLCAKLSWIVPRAIICCASAARKAYIEYGYCGKTMIVVNNGIRARDYCREFEPTRPDHWREELDIPKGVFVISCIARYHGQKGHSRLIAAAKIAAKECPNIYFVLAGRGIDWGNAALSDEINLHSLADRFKLLGMIDNVPALYSASNVSVLPSDSEGFPNVIVESMACGIPCISTDAGDAAEIVSDTGFVVRCGSPEALAGAMIRAYKMPNDELARLGARARSRAIGKYDISRSAWLYRRVYEFVLRRKLPVKPGAENNV